MDKRLLLLRHAKSSWGDDTLPDHDRPLNARGVRAAALMGVFLAQEGVRPDLVLCSTARRTRETWDRVRAQLDAEVPVRTERALYLAPAEAMLERLRDLDDAVTSVLVVAHNPGTEELARALAGRGDRDALARLRQKLPTCGLADLRPDVPRWGDLAPGCATLAAFLVPKDLV